MSKRGASDQITRENIGDNSDDDSVQQHTKASAAVMAKRKILKPRGRGKTDVSGDLNKDSNGSADGSAFGSGFGTTFNPTNPNSSSFGFSSTAPKAVSDKNEQIKALNEKFLEKITSNNKPGSVCDFSAVCKKYIEFYEKIQSGSIEVPENPVKAAAPVANNGSNAFSSIKPVSEIKKPEEKPVAKKPESSDSESESDDEEVKIEGPTFVFAATKPAKKLPFSFGPKPAKKPSSDSDSESEVEIKGPSFTFNKKIEDKIFKLAPQKGAEDSESKTTLEKANEVNKTKPAFSFGSTSTNNKNSETSEEKSAFIFNKKTDDKPTAFSFTSSTSNSNESKPAFSFGSASKQPEEISKTTDKPAFSFSSNSTNEKPSFSFGSNATTSTTSGDDKPKFSFGNTQSMDDKPAFSFGSTTTSEKKEDTNVSTPTTGGFSFGKPSSDSSTTETQKPAFSFSFNPPKNAEATDNNKQAFSFGSANNTFSNGFSFGKTNDTPAASVNQEDNKVETVAEEEIGGNFEPIAKLSEKSEVAETGEENEVVLYEKRAKLMLFDPSKKDEPYSNRGLGDLKILKSKENGKSRILVRADGGLRVLLNTLISKEMTYSTIGNGSMVRVPTVVPSTKSIETYVLRVKTPSDGQDLLNVLNDAKS